MRSPSMLHDARPSRQVVATSAASSARGLPERCTSASGTHGSNDVGVELGKRQQEVAHVAFGIEHEHGNTGEQDLLEQHHAEPGLAGARHADDDAVGRQLRRRVAERLVEPLVCRGVDPGSEEQPTGGHVDHALSLVFVAPLMRLAVGVVGV